MIILGNLLSLPQKIIEWLEQLFVRTALLESVDTLKESVSSTSAKVIDLRKSVEKFDALLE